MTKIRAGGIVLGLVVLGAIWYLAAPAGAGLFLSPSSSGPGPADGAGQFIAGPGQASPEEVISRTYTWHYGAEMWSWELEIPAALYRYYQGLPRSETDNYSVYVTDTRDDEYIGRLVSAIKEAAAGRGYGQYETLWLAITFVQNLPYNADSETTHHDEYPRYPVETLVDMGGDCEDTSVLLASMLQSLGYGVVLVNPPHHWAVGVLGEPGRPGRYYLYKDESYYYLETTNPGWGIGELPHEYRFVPAYVCGIEPVPVLTHSWQAEAQDGLIVLEVSVENSGAVTAQNVTVWAGFEVGEGQWLNPLISPRFDLPSGGSSVVSLTLRAPAEPHARLLVQIVDDGWAVDSSRSYWFDAPAE